MEYIQENTNVSVQKVTMEMDLKVVAKVIIWIGQNLGCETRFLYNYKEYTNDSFTMTA